MIRWLWRGGAAVMAALMASCGGDGGANKAATPAIPIPVAALAVTPSSLVFPDTAVGSSYPMVLRFTNTSAATVVLSTGYFNGVLSEDFHLTGDSDCVKNNIEPGNSCALEVTFKPSTLGSYAATLSLVTEGASIQPISLSGNGTVPLPKLEVSAESIEFPDTPVGALGERRTLTITSTGNAPLNLGSFNLISGRPEDFKFGGGDCPAVLLERGDSCHFYFYPAPRAPGDLFWIITIDSNATGLPRSVTLTGKGVTATQRLTVSPLTFPDTLLGETATGALTLTNTGGLLIDDFHLGDILPGASSADFTVAGTTCGASLQYPSSCTYTLHFTPSALGPRSATLFVFSPGPSLTTVSGNGVAVATRHLVASPTSVTFPDTMLGTQSASQDVTITNTGSATATIAHIVFAGGPVDSFVETTGDCDFSIVEARLAPGQSCTLHLAFKPVALGQVESSVSLSTYDAADGTLVVPLKGRSAAPMQAIVISPTALQFEDTQPGLSSKEESLTVTNVGTAPIVFEYPLLNVDPGTPSGDFVITHNDCVLSLDVGAQCHMTLQFRPSAPTYRGASLVVRPWHFSSQFVPLLGKGIPFSNADTQPRAIDFGMVPLGGAPDAEHVITITVVGPGDADITAVDLGGANPGDFAIDRKCSGMHVPAGSACAFVASFVPTALGSRSATVSVSVKGQGPGVVTLTGTGATASRSLTLSPDPLAFPGVMIGALTLPKPVTVTNAGSLAVTISAVGFTGANADAFSIYDTDCIGQIARGASCKVWVAFRPTEIGPLGASLVVTSDADAGPQSIALTGLGIPATPSTYSIGGTLSGLTRAGLVLANGADTTSPAANATSFVFGTKLASGATYDVTIATQPTAETCTLSNASGTVATADVSSVQVSCTPSSAGTWIWESGPNTAPALPVFGTPGTPAPGNVPGGRDRSVAWRDTSGNLYLFGGEATDELGQVGAFNDFWKFEPVTHRWTWLGGSKQGNALGIYGTQETPALANFPGAREDATAWTDASGNFWVFGGAGYDSIGGSRLNDLWKYDIASHLWTWMSGVSLGTPAASYGVPGVADPANVPGGRNRAMSWTDSDGNLWLFGGEGYAGASSNAPTSFGFLNDLWRYSPSTGLWTWIGGSSIGSNDTIAPGRYGTRGTASDENVPGQREEATTWTDANGNLWLFGGAGYDALGHSGLLNDLWKYMPSTKQWTWVSGSNAVNAPAVGAPGTTDSANTPEARHRAISWVDQDGMLWLLGGDAVAGTRNDLWKFDTATSQWTWVSGSPGVLAPSVYGTLQTPSPSNVPGARAGGVTWVDGSGNLWLLGGSGIDSTGAMSELGDLWRYAR
ncbi:MAG TPA: choice-of-anchor D domain-containing protein [Povalibacter sp.]|nr:choice-of-anchor D domain-containing protein [Povalibacter sp.]